MLVNRIIEGLNDSMSLQSELITSVSQQVLGCMAKIETAIKNINLPNKKSAALGI